MNKFLDKEKNQSLLVATKQEEKNRRYVTRLNDFLAAKKKVIKWLQKNVTFILVIVALGSWFYWFEWRPMEIRKECSRIEQHSDPVPELTQAQIDQEVADYNACVAAHPIDITAVHSFDDLVDNIPYNCGSENAGNQEPHPAVPAKTYYVPADSKSYSYCIHSHGL